MDKDVRAILLNSAAAPMVKRQLKMKTRQAVNLDANNLRMAAVKMVKLQPMVLTSRAAV